MHPVSIFFDIDGVLIDGFHTNHERRVRWDKTIQQDLGIDFDDFQTIFSGWFPEVIQGRLDFTQELGRWLDTRGYGVSAKDVMEYWHSKDTNLNPDIWSVVQSLARGKKVRLYTATNQTHERMEYLKEHLGFGTIFEDLYYSARLGCLKSDPRSFRTIEKELSLDIDGNPPLYFDDDPRNIEIALTCGWDAVLVDTAKEVIEHPMVRNLLD